MPRDQIQKFPARDRERAGGFRRPWLVPSTRRKVVSLGTAVGNCARSGSASIAAEMTSDYDQATFLIGACFDNSGINVTATLRNSNFAPHPALEALLDWFARRGATTEIRNAASRAGSILRHWNATHPRIDPQLTLFDEEVGATA